MLHLTLRVWFMHIIGHGYPAGHSLLVHVQESARYRLWVHLCAYLALLAIALVGDYYTKYRERQVRASQLEAQLSQARLHALRMQLNPHFLFNALNSIAMLTRKNESANAVRMLAGLGDLLRHVLEEARADEVRLREELEFVGRYLDIERVREFLDINNPEAARQAMRLILAALERAEQFPELGRPTIDPDIRQLVIPFGNAGYIVRYMQMPGGDILVLRLWHGREARK